MPSTRPLHATLADATSVPLAWYVAPGTASPAGDVSAGGGPNAVDVMPDGSMVAPGCTRITNAGQVAWVGNPGNESGCSDAVGDDKGNIYVSLNLPRTQTLPSTQVVEAVSSSGALLWRTAVGCGNPALGPSSSVFFVCGDTVMGFDEQTGATTFTSPNIPGIYAGLLIAAYSGGIAVVSQEGTDLAVTYVSYAGTILNSYTSDIVQGYYRSIAAGADGAVFFAGYDSSCPTNGASFHVEKFAPSGLVWSWISPSVTSPGCAEPSSISATPDGGAVVAQFIPSDTAPPFGFGPVTFTSVGPTGTLRWIDAPSGPFAPAYYAEPPVVDSNGVVGLPTVQEITCADGITDTCSAFHIDFVSQTSTNPTLSAFDWSDTTRYNTFADFGELGIAIDAGRIYINRDGLNAFSQSGLATSWTLSLQEALTGSGATGCAPLLVVGVRGSGEPGPGGKKATKSNPWYGGFGQTISDVVHPIAAAVPGSQIESLSYPAVNAPPLSSLATYFQSVDTGDQALSSLVSSAIASCRSTKILLAGLSQGAQVVAETYGLLPSKAIAGVVLIGDPYFNGSQVRVDVGNYDSSLNGVFASLPGGSPRVASANLASKLASYCHSGDWICNVSAANAAKCSVKICPHGKYFKELLPNGVSYTKAATQFLLDRYFGRQLNPLTVTTTNLPSVQVKQKADYRVQLGVSGGTAPYKWNIQSGSLPVGLRLTNQGIVKGRPTVLDLPGVYSFNVAAFDAAGHRASALLQLTLLPRT